MLDILEAALAALTNRDEQLTERWKLAQQQLEHAKHEENVARQAVQYNAGVRAKLARYCTALKVEGTS